MPQSSVDPAALLHQGYLECKAGSRDPDAFARSAASKDLAAAATAESSDTLARQLTALAAERGFDACLFALAIEKHACALDDLGRPDLALPLYDACRPLFVQFAPPEVLNGFHYREAFVWKHLGRLPQTVACYDRAIEITERLVEQGRPESAEELASALTNKANALATLGQHEQADACRDRAIAVKSLSTRAGRPEDRFSLAVSLLNRANSAHDRGGLASALADYDRAIEEFTQAAAQPTLDGLHALATALNGRGAILEAQGKWREAIAAFTQVVALRKDLLRRADSLPNNGGVDVNRFLLLDSLAAASNNLGNALLNQNAPGWQRALDAFADCIHIREALVAEGHADAREGLARVLINVGRVFSGMREPAKAIGAYERAIELLGELVEGGWRGLAPELARAWSKLGAELIGTKDFIGAMSAFGSVDEEALSDLERYQYHLFVAHLFLQIDGHDRLGKSTEHFARCREVLRASRRRAGIDETTLEFVAARQGVIEQAILHALGTGQPEVAFAALQDSKATVLGDLFGVASGATTDPPDLLEARARLTKTLAHPDAPADSTRLHADEYLRLWSRSRHLIEKPLAEAPAPLPPDLATIRTALPLGWAILDLWHSDPFVFAFVVTSEGLTVLEAPFPLDLFDADLSPFLRTMSAHGTPGDLAFLEEVYSHLFAPLLPWLRERRIRGLYLVPHGQLHALPLHAARSPEGRYLCDEFDIAYLPSSAMLPRLPAPRFDGPLFSMSNPERDTEYALPFAEWEGEQIEHRYRSRGGIFLRGREASLGRTTDWGESALIHFSGHGVGDPSFAPLSHLRLADDLLLAHDVVYRRPPLREGAVVLLNGCQTAVRDARAFDEGMGLMTAFLLRGASFVLATQWAVEDRLAAAFVLAFLDQLLDRGASPTQAMRHAQRTVRGLPAESRAAERGMKPLAPVDSRPTEVSPLLWSAFQLVGRVT